MPSIPRDGIEAARVLQSQQFVPSDDKGCRENFLRSAERTVAPVASAMRDMRVAVAAEEPARSDFISAIMSSGSERS